MSITPITKLWKQVQNPTNEVEKLVQFRYPLFDLSKIGDM